MEPVGYAGEERGGFLSGAGTAGLEPATYGLTVRCSTY